MAGQRQPPGSIAPMLASPAGRGNLPKGPGWAFEFKYDGVRAISHVDRGGVRVFSRNLNDVTGSYPELAELGSLLRGRQAVVDGEVVALEADRPSFARLQQRMHVAAPTEALLRTVPVVYVVFDVLGLDGEATTDLPYGRRRKLLVDLGLDGLSVRTAASFTDVDGAAVLRTAELAGMEGILAKRLDAPYRPGRRSPDWIKQPLLRTQEVVVVGYTAGAGRRAGMIGALLLAVVDAGGALAYAGNVGTGFTDAMLRHLQEVLAPLRRSAPPVPDVPREQTRGVQWVEPELVGEVVFRNWSPDSRLRHAAWRGLRPDRHPTEAIRAAPASADPPAAAAVQGAMQTPDGGWRVEVIGRGGARWYRVTHGDSVLDWLSLADVERVLAAAGIALDRLDEVSVPAA